MKRNDDGLRRVSDGLDEILERLGVPEAMEYATLAAEWDRIAGEPFSGRSRPAGLRGGELVVEVGDGATATLLKYRVSELIERVAARFGPGQVTSVRVRVATRKSGR